MTCSIGLSSPIHPILDAVVKPLRGRKGSCRSSVGLPVPDKVRERTDEERTDEMIDSPLEDSISIAPLPLSRK